MNSGVVMRATERARRAETVQGRISREVSLEIVSEVVEILLLRDRGFHDGWRGPREVDPAKVAFHNREVMQQLGWADGWRYSKPKESKRARVGGFRAVNRRLFAFLAWIKPRYGKAEKVQVFKGGIRNRLQRMPQAAHWGKSIRSIIKNVTMRGGRVWKDLVYGNLGRDAREGEENAKASQIFRNNCSVKKFLTGQVISADVNEGCLKTVTVKKSKEDGHGFGIVGGGETKGATCAVREAVEKQKVAPARWTSTRMLVDDGRAIGDEDCVMVIREGMRQCIGEFNIRGRESVNTSLESVAKGWAGFWLREFVERREACGEPWRSTTRVEKLVADELRGSQVETAEEVTEARKNNSWRRQHQA
jgi:hypothetical protein